MERVALDFPRSPIRARALFWLANARYGQGDIPGAIHWLEVLLAGSPKPAEANRAALQKALFEERFGHYAIAIAIDRRFLDSDDPLARELARGQLRSALANRWYASLYLAGLCLLGTLAVGLTAGIVHLRAPLRPLPWEVKLFLPIAGLLALVTLLEDRRVGLAVTGIAAGGALLSVLNGAYLRRVRPRGAWRLTNHGAKVGAAKSLAFCAVHGARLTDLVVTTLQQGADR